ncbi:MAG: hypothetical protein ACP5F6_07580 [Microbacter sp.]
MVINELILGQTIPKVMLIEREGGKPFYQRALIPCPHCGELHSGIKYSVQNKTAFKNWFGLYCDHCNGIIPVQRNLTSFIILTMTYPLWGWFKKSMKQKWFDHQPERYKNLNLEIDEKKNATKNYLRSGIFFGIMMFITMQIVFPLIENTKITQKSILIGIPYWLIFGLGWGLIMKWWMNKKSKEKENGNAKRSFRGFRK